MIIRSYFKVALWTTYNIILNAFTDGRFLWLEGRVIKGVFKNWARNFVYNPKNFAKPKTEEEIVEFVKKHKKVRVFGSAHSFNSGVISDEVLISLDDYSGIVRKDLSQKQVTFKGGTRMRDTIRLLLDDGLAYKALPSHDAQSIAGIISTDVHGTGNDWGFVSEIVLGIKLIDGNGDVHTLTPDDDLFRAAIGGIGAVGIISEVTVQAVDRFNVEQKCTLSTIDEVERSFDKLFKDNVHFSLYLFPFTEICQINTWNPTPKSKSFQNELREFVHISLDAFLAAWFGNLMAYIGLFPKLSTLAHSKKKNTDLVMESNAAYSRTIYHLHEELEFTVPFEKTFDAVRSFIKIYEDLYADKALPYALFEVRFTPENRTKSLIGAGQGRHSTWIDLVINDSDRYEIFYDAAEAELKKIGARPHLGKFCKSLTKGDLQKLYGENFDKFLELRAKHDPDGKFVNEFTNRLFS